MITELKFIPPSADTLAGINGKEEYNARTNKIGSISLGETTKMIDATEYMVNNDLCAMTYDWLQVIYGPVIESTNDYITFGEIDSDCVTDMNFGVAEFEFASDVNVYTYDSILKLLRIDLNIQVLQFQQFFNHISTHLTMIQLTGLLHKTKKP